VPHRLLTPRWLALHLLTAVAVAAMLWLSSWQLDRARAGAGQPLPDPVPTPLVQLAQPGRPLRADDFGRRVRVEGRYDAAHQFLVAGQRLGEEDGFWVLTLLRTDSGAGLPVVRGFVSAPSDPALTVPDWPVLVTGRLAPSQDRPPAPQGLPSSGVLDSVRTAQLASLVPYPLFDGFLTMTEQRPLGPASPRLLPDRPGPSSGGELRWQNYAYAVQWAVFAGFAGFLWWRAVRDARRPVEEQDEVASPA